MRKTRTGSPAIPAFILSGAGPARGEETRLRGAAPPRQETREQEAGG